MATIQTTTSTTSISYKTKQTFKRLNGVYRDKFARHFKSEKGRAAIEREWDSVVSSLSDAQINRGIEASKYLSDWDPIPSEFLRLSLALPKVDQCAGRVIRRELIDRVSYLVFGMITQAVIDRSSHDHIIKLVRCYYDDAYARVLTESIGKDDWRPPTALCDESNGLSPKNKEKFEKLKSRAAILKSNYGVDYPLTAKVDLDFQDDEISTMEQSCHFKQMQAGG